MGFLPFLADKIAFSAKNVFFGIKIVKKSYFSAQKTPKMWLFCENEPKKSQFSPKKTEETFKFRLKMRF